MYIYAFMCICIKKPGVLSALPRTQIGSAVLTTHYAYSLSHTHIYTYIYTYIYKFIHK